MEPEQDREDTLAPIDLVVTAGPLDPIIETLRDVLHRSGALRAVAALDIDPPVIIDAGRLQPIEIRTLERVTHLPHATPLDADPISADLHLVQPPPFEADAQTGEVVGTLGALDMLADAAAEIAARLGGGSVIVCQYATTDPECPLALTARRGEPVLVTIGEAEFELPPKNER